MTTTAVRYRFSGGERPAGWRGRLGIASLLLLAVFEVVGTVGASQHQEAHRDLDPLAILLVLAGPAALLRFRRDPMPAMGVVIGATLVYLLRGYAYGPVIVGAAVALFGAVLTGHRLAAWSGFAVLYVGHLAGRHWLLDERITWGQVLGVAAWGLLVLITAEVARVRRERLAAANTALREASRRQANEERLRIARELHDVVAHHMSLINVQAGVALHLVDRRPDQVQTALGVIKDASKEALVELRTLVGVLRDEADAAPRVPERRLASLPDLIERGAVAGLEIQQRVTGIAVPLPAAVELAGYRIIQEAVTNVVRHASATRAEIMLDYRLDELVVQVEDDGNGGPRAGDSIEEWSHGTGSGIQGMRERASALGGTLTLSRARAGGVRVRASLPLRRGS